MVLSGGQGETETWFCEPTSVTKQFKGWVQVFYRLYFRFGLGKLELVEIFYDPQYEKNHLQNCRCLL